MSEPFLQEHFMRISFASGRLVEAVVTLAAAGHMTLAGLAMLDDHVTVHSAALVGASAAPPRTDAPRG